MENHFSAPPYERFRAYVNERQLSLRYPNQEFKCYVKINTSTGRGTTDINANL